MAKGTIRRWNNERGTGWIENDAGGNDIFLHRTAVSPADRNFLVSGTAVEFDIQDSTHAPGRLDAYNLHLLEQPDEGAPNTSFHNPYTFVPSPPRQGIKAGDFAGDFDPLKCGLSHESLQPNLWTGYLPIKLTTVTPLVLPKTEGEERSSDKHQTYDILNHLPESSLRGMLRSAYEVVTNSRYSCFKNDDRLAYRMETREALKLIPAVIENGKGAGELVARLYTGTSHATAQKPNGHEEKGAMYAAMLTRYHRNPNLNSECVGGYEPRTGDEVWAEIVLCQHEVSSRGATNWRRDYTFWKVVKVWPKSQCPHKPSPTDQKRWYPNRPKTNNNNQSYYAPLNPEQRKVVEGRVLVTNENMGNKHDERIFFNPEPDTVEVTDRLEESWRMRIKSYREAHSDDEIFGRASAKPWDRIGSEPGKTAWSPHLYQDGKHRDRWGRNAHDAMELQPGDMVYARCKFDKGKITGIEDLFPVMISRELYDNSPADLLGSSLKPANERNELSPADRLFGWVPQKSGSDQGYKGRIRVVCEDGVRPEIIEDFAGEPLSLAILGQPKPAQGRFYVAKDAQGMPQEDGLGKQQAGYSKGKGLRGRKQYWHHKGLEASQPPDYWKPSVEDRTQQQRNGRYQEYRRPDQNGEPQNDSQNRSITGWIKPDTVFEASLYVQNLQVEEVGALLWLLSLPEGHFFRLGYGKPLGFGSVRMEIDKDRCVNGCLPLGTGEDWKGYYAAFGASSPATLGEDQRNDCIQQFKASMVAAYDPLPVNDETIKSVEEPEISASRRLTSLDDLKSVQLFTDPEDRIEIESEHFKKLPFISGFLQVLSGPRRDAPIHYPCLERKPNPEGENFKWFVDNEKGQGKKVTLPSVIGEKGLPYQPSSGAVHSSHTRRRR